MMKRALGYALGSARTFAFVLYFPFYCLYALSHSLLGLPVRPVAGRYALRSLVRRPRRTVLSVIGVGVGCGIGVLATSWVRGGREMQIRAASESGAGHLRVVPAGWTEKRENTLRLADWRKALAEVRKTSGVRLVENAPGVRTKAICLRARSNGLLAMGSRTSGVEIVGVTPESEMASNRVVYKSEIEGRYLEAGDRRKVVIGKALARKLRVDLDDDLHLTLSGRDEIRSDLLTIVGIIDTGSSELNSVICHVTLADMERISGYEGPGEIALLLDGHKLIDSVQKDLAARITSGDEVITWMEVNREIAANMEGDTAFTNIIVGIVLVVVSLGIMSAQLTAVLERRREFGVLLALGMKGRQVVGLIMMEGVVTALGGSVVALLTGGAFAYRLATKGVSIEEMMGGEVSIGGVLFDPVMYADFGWWVVAYAVIVSLVATFFASLYPARFATRTDPADALRVV